MNEASKSKRGWRIVRRILIGLAILATLIAIFYTEEDWRGKRAWENCKRDLEAKGMVLGWDKYIPPPVPDDQNFYTYSTNLFLRFHKQLNEEISQTPEQAAATQQLAWLRLDPADPSRPMFDTVKLKPLIVANIVVSPSSLPSPENATNYLSAALDDPATPERLRNLLQATFGRGIQGSMGYHFSEFQLSNLVPAQVSLKAENLPTLADLANWVPSNLATNLGWLRVVATSDQTVFQVQLTDADVAAAADYLKWSDQFVPAFDDIREALKRPYAILPGDYSQPAAMPIPNFFLIRSLAQTLAQRAECYLLLNQPDKALHEVTLVHDFCRILEKPHVGQPETLVEAMVNVAISGMYVYTIAEGFRPHGWQEPQLAALEEQLKTINLPPDLVAALKEEQAASIQTYETTPAAKISDLFLVPYLSKHEKTQSAFWRRLHDPLYLFLKLAPRGWLYQNLVTTANVNASCLTGFDLEGGTISPRTFDEMDRQFRQPSEHPSPFKFLARYIALNIARATQTLAANQTLVNEAQIACALERYRLAHGKYPETLDTLVPQFIEQLPHDLIGGQPLHYRRTDDGSFLLYSVGWNEKDDGGSPGSLGDVTKGDWVWGYWK